MGITERTVQECTCDKCHRVLLRAADGIAVVGQVYSLFSPCPPRAADSAPITVWCWSCLRHTFSGGIPELEQALARVAELEQALSNAQADYAALAYADVGPGPSGPLPPPELPHGVTVARVLSGARVR